MGRHLKGYDKGDAMIRWSTSSGWIGSGLTVNGKCRSKTRRINSVFIALAAFTSLVISSPAGAVPTLWGVDEDDGELFSLSDYTTLNGFVSYGELKYDTGTVLGLANVGKHIEAFALDIGGMAYMVVNADVIFDEPVWMSFDVKTASTVSDNEVTLIDTMGLVFDNDGDNITGLSFRPITGDLYGLFRDDRGSTVDKLIIIDKTNGDVTIVGSMTGLGETVGKGEDLKFDRFGNLYVTDNADDELYQVDPATGAIIAVIDNNQQGGLGVGNDDDDIKFEALAWDYESDVLIGFSDKSNFFAQFDLTQNGNNQNLGSISGLTDVEGLGFFQPTSEPIIPEPSTLILLLLGTAGLFAFAWRKRHSG